MSKMQLKHDLFKKVLLSLQAIYLKPVDADRINIDATIKRFEFTFELSWKCLKQYFQEQGIIVNYPKEIIKEAFATGLINDEQLWLQMLNDRNMTSHTYNRQLADQIHHHIKQYVPRVGSFVKQTDHCLGSYPK